VPEYIQYLEAIESTVDEVNARHGDVIELRVDDNFLESVAAYARYDVLLVNAVFDGMNLVAKEGPLVNERDGVLVLSENAGAHEELAEWALTVNPYDISGQAEALHQALSMAPDERRRRAEGLREHVREHDVHEWLAGLLGDFERTLPA
jgi:trehalose 6-phosphate synthase